MLPNLQEIRTAIDTSSVLKPSNIGSLDHDEILDARDTEASFEDQWVQAFEKVNVAWEQFGQADDFEKLIEEIRHASFMAVSKVTHQHEIASYISDDFEMIAKASVTETVDPFILAMWSAYQRQEIPGPDTAK